MVSQRALTKPRITDYSRIEPLPDPPRRRDMRQNEAVWYFFATLKPHFADRSDVMLGGGGYLVFDAGDVGEFYPDCVFADGVSDPPAVIWRNGYVISEVGKPPDFVLEVASRSTGRRDYTVKREGYARYGVGEYWRFDPTGGEFHDVPLGGDKLNEDGVYEPIEIVIEPDGRRWGYSEALGLELWWENKRLRFRDPVSGEFLPTVTEWRDRADAAETLTESERARAVVAETLLESERDARVSAEERADAAEARVAKVEAELRRLRGE